MKPIRHMTARKRKQAAAGRVMHGVFTASGACHLWPDKKSASEHDFLVIPLSDYDSLVEGVARFLYSQFPETVFLIGRGYRIRRWGELPEREQEAYRVKARAVLSHLGIPDPKRNGRKGEKP